MLIRGSRPNVVIVLADDLGYGDLGRHNHGASQTAALDQLMDEGLSLSQSYSASPVCAPARAAMLTGRYPHRTGAIDTLEARGLDRIALRERTLPQLLAETGYRTGLMGKWHNGAIDQRYHPTRRGFHEFSGFLGGWQDYQDWRIETGGRRVSADGRYLTDVITQDATDFIRRHRDGPFFLQVAYNAPHLPLQAPEELIERFSAEGRTRAVATIYAMVHVMDQGIAAIRETLQQEGVAENTILIFASDNGPQFSGTGEASTHRFNCGLAGAKAQVYEGGIRVPTIIHWPAGLDDAGVTSSAMMHFVDWMPTILRLCGATEGLQEGLPLDGTDRTAELRGEDRSQPDRFWQWNRYEPLRSVNAAMRRGDWKLLYPPVPEAIALPQAELDRDADIKRRYDEYTDIDTSPPPVAVVDSDALTPKLFDLAADPFETEDVSAAQPEITHSMTAALQSWFEDVERERRGAVAADSAVL